MPITIDDIPEVLTHRVEYNLQSDGSDTQVFRDELVDNFGRFMQKFAKGNTRQFYLKELKMNVHNKKYHVVVNVEDVRLFNDKTYELLKSNPTVLMRLFEEAAMAVAIKQNFFPKDHRPHPIQVVLRWSMDPTKIRNMKSDEMARLIVVNGIVVSCGSPKPQSITTLVRCRGCGDEQMIDTSGGFASRIPSRCIASVNAGGAGPKCPTNPYEIVPSECKYADHQFLKLQELPDDVPTGEMPRRILIHVDRKLVDQVTPGMKVSVVGVYTLREAKTSVEGRKAAGVRHAFLRGLGIWKTQTDTEEQTNIESTHPEQESLFQKMAKDKDIYTKIARSIDPFVYGMEDVKKAIACQLFGGSRKFPPQGTPLRGDINVLLIGDPSTGKSQLLKYAHKVAPIAVYTSGKGSSAAGLTASVVREKGGDFYLEGGAMVLGDGGMVCIDEFDKMNPNDRSAIHEAMEQQTISIAKAGITTMLNSRTSVLAASNPRFGSYDSMKVNEDQLDLQNTVLTRFDLIFKVLDPRDPKRDKAIADHVVSLHKSYHGGQKTALVVKKQTTEDTFDIATLKRYIAYCKDKVRPQLSEEAQNELVNYYVQAKKDANKTKEAGVSAGRRNNGKGQISITVRQLEAIVRLSESLAKMRLASHATITDVQEAWRLFRVSTVDLIQSGIDLPEGSEIVDELRKAEHAIRRHLPVGITAHFEKLKRMLQNMDFQLVVIEKAIAIMRARGELEFSNQRKKISRKR